jgi:hypothetical protein
MPLFSSAIFGIVRWKARKGLLAEHEETRVSGVVAVEQPLEKKMQARRTGIRGETYAYWYLRRHGYVFVA